MTVPLVVLGVFATLSGLFNTPFGESVDYLADWLEPMLAHEHELLPGSTLAILAVVAIAVAIGGIAWAWNVYQRGRGSREAIEQPAFQHALYIDETYSALVGGPGEAAAEGLAEFDSGVVDGAVNGVGWLSQASGRVLRVFQSGFVRAYALAVAGGAVVLMVFVVIRMSSS
jgi:NADH-quinone oxidoreductase subunit L